MLPTTAQQPFLLEDSPKISQTLAASHSNIYRRSDACAPKRPSKGADSEAINSLPAAASGLGSTPRDDLWDGLRKVCPTLSRRDLQRYGSTGSDTPRAGSHMAIIEYQLFGSYRRPSRTFRSAAVRSADSGQRRIVVDGDARGSRLSALAPRIVPADRAVPAFVRPPRAPRAGGNEDMRN